VDGDGTPFKLHGNNWLFPQSKHLFPGLRFKVKIKNEPPILDNRTNLQQYKTSMIDPVNGEKETIKILGMMPPLLQK